MTVLNLFRGQCIGIAVDEISDDVLLTLDLEDYNRLPPIINVGAPTGTVGLTQDDGTVIWQDPRAGNTGAAAAFATFADGGYWPDASLALDLVTGFLAPEVPGTPLIDEMSALTNLKAFVDDQAPRVSGALRWWLAPPPSGDGLILYWVDYLDPVEVALLPAPFAIDDDAPDWTTSVMPMHLGPISWDWANVRGSVYVRGGTPAPEGSGYATGVGSSPAGDAYVDAPGSITNDDKTAIGLWHQNREFAQELLTGSATIPPFVGTVNYVGWDVGQTVLVTSAKHSRFVDHDLVARPAVIQRVVGRLIGPGTGLGITIDGTPLDKPYEWTSFTFEKILASPGKATVVIHLLGDTDTLTIAKLADVWITFDDTNTNNIEHDLAFGDIPAGSLTSELAKAAVKPPPAVAYRFNVEDKDAAGVMLGVVEQVSAQLATGPATPVALGGVPMEWVLLQWTDIAATVPGDLLRLGDDIGTTDSEGRVFTTLGGGGPAIDTVSADDPAVVTTTTDHGLVTGATVVLSGIVGAVPPIAGAYVVTVLSPTTFSIPVAVTNAGTGGTAGKTDPLPTGYNWEVLAVALPIV